MASNNQKCVWVYAIGYELVHYFQTEEEADVWWASYKVEVGDDVEGAIEQVWMFQKPLATALALPSSKTNWTATVPARAPPPPPPVTWKEGMCWTCCVKPGTNSTFRDALGENELTCDDCHREEYPEQYEEPVTQATMLKRTHEIQCGKCAISDYAENIGVWNDGKLQELGLCGECEEEDELTCDGCGTTCLDHTSNKGRGSESPCEECGETRCKFCPCECEEEEDDGARCDICCGCGKFTETGNVCDCGGAHRELCDDCKEEEATTEFARNKICDECGCKGGCELTCVYVCGEPCEICGATSDINDDWHGNSVCDECFMCCEECYNTKNPAVFEKTASDLCECEDKVQCEHCEGAVSDEGGIIVVMGQEMTICESCDMGGDCYDGFLDEYHYNAETNDYEEKEASQQAPKCLTDGCECEAAKNQYYPNSSWGEFWTLCEKCYEEDQEEDEPIPYCYENGKYSAPIPCGCPIPCRVSSSDDESEEEEEIVGKCQCCECDVTTDQDYLKLKTGPGAGRIYCEEHVGWGECQKAWSASCGCDVCADEEEQDE